MNKFLFLYNILLICLCSGTLATSILTYKKTQQVFYLYIPLLSACFILELTILQYICSSIYFSGQKVDTETLNHISFNYIRIAVYLSILLLEFLCILWITQTAWKTKFLLWFLPALILYSILGFSEQTNFVVWSFYSIRQFYQFAFLLFFTYHCLTVKEETQKQHLEHFVIPMTGIFFLNCSVLIEDSLMISHLSAVLFETPWMSERNFSENLLWFFLCCCFIYMCSQQLLEHAPTNENISSCQIPLETNALQENNIQPSTTGPLLQNLPAFSEYYKLTPRETEILKCLTECRHTSEICEELHISTGTVKTHIHNIYMKLEINTRTELMRELSEFSNNQESL